MKKTVSKSKSPTKNNSKSPKNRIDSGDFNPMLQTIKEDFNSHVYQKILKLDIMAKTELPLRCLIHNNVISLYCEIDRQPLCANCMYETQKHRNHRVVPLEKAENFIKEDIKSFRNKLGEIVE